MCAVRKIAITIGFAISLLLTKTPENESYKPVPRNAILYETIMEDPELGEVYKFDVGTKTTDSYLIPGSKKELDDLDKSYNTGDCVVVRETGNYHRGTMILRPDDIRKVSCG